MELGERRRRILAAVVNDYVKTAEPVGSEALVQRYDFGVKPATIRNELAAISELGYLRQPHTSAGRIPSDLGYRYYVDRLMPEASLTPAESDRARQSYDPYESEVEHIIQQTCRILSSLTEYTSLATPPRMDSVSIRHVALSPVEEGKLLVVIVLNTGCVEHHVLDCRERLPASDVMALGNLIEARFKGAEVRDIAMRAGEEVPQGLRRLSGLYGKITAILKQVVAGAEDDEVYVEGTTHILKQPEFAYHERMASILEALEHRKALFQVLSSVLLGKDVTVIVGAENRFEEMQECSFVASHYSVGGRVCGSIGVVGPTRMDYRRAVAAVQFMSSSLSELLTSLSIG